jgi:hypothetical protein
MHSLCCDECLRVAFISTLLQRKVPTKKAAATKVQSSGTNGKGKGKAQSSEGAGTGKRKKGAEKPEGKKRKKKDPNAPKRGMTAFMHFSQENREVGTPIYLHF